MSNENINERGPRPGGIPLVTPTQPTNPLFEMSASLLQEGGKQPSSLEFIQIIFNKLNFSVSCFAEAQLGHMCYFKKWGFLSEGDNGVAGCDLSSCVFSCRHLLSEPFPSACIKKSHL